MAVRSAATATDLRRRAAPTCGGRSARWRRSACAAASGSRSSMNDEPAFIAWFLGCMRIGRGAGAAVDDADRQRARRDRRRRRRGRRSSSRPSYAARSPRRSPRGTGAARTRVVDRRRRLDEPDAADVARAGRRSPTTSEVPAAARPRRLAGVLALHLGHHRRCRRASCTATATCRPRPRRTPARCSASPRRPLPVGRQAVLRLRAGQLAHVPVLGRAPTACSTPAGRRRAASAELVAAERADAVLRQPRVRRRPARRRRRPADVRARCAPVHRRRGAARRSATPVLRALRLPRARRHRLDRGAAHLPVQPPGRRAARHERVAGRRATRPSCSTTTAPGRRPPTPRATSTCAGRRSPPATGAATEATARPTFRRRVAAHRRRVHPLGTTALDVPRPQQRHDQGGRHLGVAGRGRERARRAPRRARGRGRRRAQR